MRACLFVCLVATGCGPSRATDCPGPAASQLFVATADGEILAFDAAAEGSPTPLRSVGMPGFSGPLAVDATSHELFGARGSTVDVHPSIAGEPMPIRTMTGLNGDIVGLATDPARRALFILTDNGLVGLTVVSEDDAGQVSWLDDLGGLIPAVALDPLHGEVVAATPYEIDVYPRDGLTGGPSRTHQANGGPLSAIGLAVDTLHDDLYVVIQVAQSGMRNLLVFDGATSGTAPPKNGISTVATGPVAVDCARGELFVATLLSNGQPGVNVFAADGSFRQIRHFELTSRAVGLALGP